MLTVLWHELPVSCLRNMATVNPETQASQRHRIAKHFCLHCVNYTGNSCEGGHIYDKWVEWAGTKGSFSKHSVEGLTKW